MPLSDTAIRNAKPSDKPYKLPDEKGLYLYVAITGGKLWRMDYRHDGKRKTLSFGGYPDMSLKEARERRDEARKLLANGQDPGEVKKAQKAARVAAVTNSFEAVTREWFEKWKTDKAQSYSTKIALHLRNDILPWLGGKPVSEIEATDVRDILQRIVDRGALDTAHRCRKIIAMVMRYAIVTGRAKHNPVPDLQGFLMPVKKKHMPTLTKPAEVGALMRAIDTYKGSNIVRAAFKLAPLFFVRIGELRTMKWADVDLDKAEWSHVASKTMTDHIVPLPRQAVSILRDILPLSDGEHVFPGRVPGQPICEGTINKALRKLGYNTKTEITGHGFRAMARTLLEEELHFLQAPIELQLAHTVSDTNGRAYNRTVFLKERHAMMQAWADYLDKLKIGANVIQFKAG